MVLLTAGENYGHVIAEALQAGCPVITTPTTPWTQVLRGGGGEIVEDRDNPAEVAAVLDRWATKTPDELAASRHRARQAFETFAARQAPTSSNLHLHRWRRHGGRPRARMRGFTLDRPTRPSPWHLPCLRSRGSIDEPDGRRIWRSRPHHRRHRLLRLHRHPPTPRRRRRRGPDPLPRRGQAGRPAPLAQRLPRPLLRRRRPRPQVGRRCHDRRGLRLPRRRPQAGALVRVLPAAGRGHQRAGQRQRHPRGPRVRGEVGGVPEHRQGRLPDQRHGHQQGDDGEGRPGVRPQPPASPRRWCRSPATAT